MKIAIIDIGTNSVHMVIVQVSKNFSVEILDRAKEHAQLGDTSFQEGVLSDEAVERGLSAIRKFKKLADIQGAQKIKAVATSAVREALNGGDFIERIRAETGIKVQVITGEEEARLIYLAVKHSIPFLKKPFVIVDIGGGSVEIVIANERGMLESWSLKLGTLRLRGDFLPKDPAKDPPGKKQLQKLNKHIAKTLSPIITKIRSYKVETLIGTSGTLMNLVSMAHFLKSDRSIEMMNHYRIEASYLKEIHEMIFKMNRRERLKIRGMEPSRADLVLPGSAVVNHILKQADLMEVMLCDEAIREGVIYDYLEKNRSKIELEENVPNIRLRSVIQLARKCDSPEKHTGQVQKLTLSLFDQTRSLHKLGLWERELLSYAALLHDVGYHVHFKKHHKHSYYLIKNADMNGFEEREIELMANLARYHAKSTPKKTHENWIRLSEIDQKIVRIGAAILKLADGLDRTRFEVVKKIKCKVSRKNIVIEVFVEGDAELDIWTANKKKDYFEEVFGKKVFLKLKVLR